MQSQRARTPNNKHTRCVVDNNPAENPPVEGNINHLPQNPNVNDDGEMRFRLPIDLDEDE